MRNKRGIPVLVLCALAALVFCTSALSADKKAPQTKPDPDVVATVNGVPIERVDLLVTMSMFQRQFAMRGKRVAPEDVPALKRTILERLISDELFYQQAKKQGVKVDTEAIKKRLDEAKKRYPSEAEFKRSLEKEQITEEKLMTQACKQKAVQQLLSDKFFKNAEPSDEEVKKYYKDNPSQFRRKEEVRASHILLEVDPAKGPAAKVDALKKIREIAGMVKQGKDFGDLAKKFSACPSSERQGDLGYFTRDKMVKPFADAAFSLKVGQVSDVVETQYGYHLIKVTDKKPASNVPFEEVKPGIKNYLATMKLEEMTSKYGEDLRKKAKVIILDESLKGDSSKAAPAKGKK